MAIFSCVKPTSHDTLPRASLNSHRRPLARLDLPNGQERAATSIKSPGGNAVDQLATSSPLARMMSRRNGNGARLRKRGREVTKSMIGAPTDYQHVSHVNRDQALKSKEMAEIVSALQPSSTTPLSPSETIIISNTPPGATETTAESIQPQDQSQARQSLDGPNRKPTVNKRKAPPPVTPSIIKAAGLPPSLAATNAGNLPLSPLSPSANAQALRSTPVKLKAKRQSRPSPTDHNETGLLALVVGDNGSPGKQGIDGLGLLDTPSTMDGLPAPPPTAAAPPSPAASPARSATLQNLALSESMENVAKHRSETIEVEVHNTDDKTATLQPAQTVTASPSGPLAYMTDSTKIRWNNGMAEIARQLKQQDLST
ncbi:hypothetical protein P389DRAFT_212877 [Cystobasidium minutum MCA 4210]|uniref:uncharacterized protein n=1 Tax=Cystobasidium minutum MCA 4210 TaxID=1397322 RepID=UPI0034CFF2C0|eukprot:jgi/Rhomi1/212877/estExt_Genemark1.C_80085